MYAIELASFISKQGKPIELTTLSDALVRFLEQLSLVLSFGWMESSCKFLLLSLNVNLHKQQASQDNLTTATFFPIEIQFEFRSVQNITII